MHEGEWAYANNRADVNAEDSELRGLGDMTVTQMRQLIDEDARLRCRVSKAIGGPGSRSREDMRRDIEHIIVG